jgi:hypothetical protein
MLLSKFFAYPLLWKIFGREACLQKTDVTHEQNNVFKVALKQILIQSLNDDLAL